MPRQWRPDEFARLFARFPLDGPTPTDLSVARLADEMRRTRRQTIELWLVARHYVRGEPCQAYASLRAYLDAHRDQP